MGHGLRRSRLSDESMGALPEFELRDYESDAAIERDEIEFLIDPYGNAIWVDEQARRIRTPEQADADREVPVGYVEFARTEEPDPRWMVDGNFDSDANLVTPRMLQRSTGGETYTTDNGDVRKKGGGGGDSAGKAKSAGGGGNGNGNTRPATRDPAARHLDEMAVYGLTDEDAQFFRDRPGLAREVLEATAVRIDRGEESVWIDAATSSTTRSKGAKRDFCVYGLEPLHVYLLRTFPGTAKRSLSTYAREHRLDKIAWREEATVAA